MHAGEVAGIGNRPQRSIEQMINLLSDALSSLENMTHRNIEIIDRLIDGVGLERACEPETDYKTGCEPELVKALALIEQIGHKIVKLRDQISVLETI